LQLSLSHRQAILKHGHSKNAYEEKLDHALEAAAVDLEAKIAPAPHERTLGTTASANRSPRWPLFAGGFVAVALIVTAGIWWTQRGAPEPVANAGNTTTTVSSSAIADEKKSIVVLPFVNMSSDAEQTYFAEGISEELINLLAKNPEIKVVSRSSAFSFKGRNVDTPTVAKKLGVDHVLEGAVRKSGDTVRITVQLVDVKTDSPLWSESYDRSLSDIFAVQDEIAVAVMVALEASLLEKVPRAREVDVEAYTLYLQARYLIDTIDAHNMRQARTLLQRALEIDPRFADAWNELSRTYNNEAILGLRPWGEGLLLAREAVEKGRTFDPGNGLIESSLSWIAAFYDLDMPAAAHHLQVAMEIDPTNVDRGAILVLSALGRFQQAIVLGEYMVSHDPLCSPCYGNLSTVYFSAGHLPQAEAAIRKAMVLSPDGGVNFHGRLGIMLLQKGEMEAALDEFQNEPDPRYRLSGIAQASHALDRTRDFEDAFAQLREGWPDWSMGIAQVYAWIGDADTAFAWLNETDPKRDFYALRIRYPVFENLHGDPRWQTLLAKSGLSMSQLAELSSDITLPE
jgi:TolB-like protein